MPLKKLFEFAKQTKTQPVAAGNVANAPSPELHDSQKNEMNQNAKVNSPILGALLWMTMVFLALFVFLASYLPIVNEL